MNQDTTAEGKVRTPPSVADVMRTIGRDARAAALALSLASTDQKNHALRAAAASLRARRHTMIAANDRDMREAAAKGLSPALLDRLKLDEKRVEAMARGLDDIAQLADPIGTVLAEWTRPNGMKIQRVRVPLGVIGIIYESRPNVTADAGALCLKSSNAVILRGGTESTHSSAAIHSCLDEGLTVAGLPGSCIQLVPTTDRAAVGYMLAEMVNDIDVIVPRGGTSLIARVQPAARVPVTGHLEGVRHVYVDRGANLQMAKDIVLNAKLRRTGVCGAAETLLVDRACAATHLKPLIDVLLAAGCEVRGDQAVQAVDRRAKPASHEDWSTEYLDAIITAGLVDGVAGAIAHVERYGSHHTDAIVTDDPAAAEKFLA